MKERIITITSKNISPKQWSSLVIELSLIVKAWKSYATLELQTRDLKKILNWGTRKHDEK